MVHAWVVCMSMGFAELVAGGDPTPDQQRTLHTLETIDAIHAAMI